MMLPVHLKKISQNEITAVRFRGHASPGQLGFHLSLAQAVIAFHFQKALIQHALTDHIHAFTYLTDINNENVCQLSVKKCVFKPALSTLDTHKS